MAVKEHSATPIGFLFLPTQAKDKWLKQINNIGLFRNTLFIDVLNHDVSSICVSFFCSLFLNIYFVGMTLELHETW